MPQPLLGHKCARSLMWSTFQSFPRLIDRSPASLAVRICRYPTVGPLGALERRMNHVYRLVWSSAQGVWQAVGETARGRGKAGAGSSLRRRARRLTLLPVTLMSGLAGFAQAQTPPVLPQGGTVSAGSASLSQTGTALSAAAATERADRDQRAGTNNTHPRRPAWGDIEPLDRTRPTGRHR